MKKTKQRARRLFLQGVIVAALPLAAHAQADYPARAVTMVVPFGPGGSPDVFARIVSEKLEKRIGQPVVIENRAGGNSTIGTAHVARAKPDGYTILYATNSSLASAPFLFKNLTYDPLKDFAGITIANESYFAMLVHPSDKDLSLAQFIERSRKDPGRYPIGGSSSTQETINSMLAKTAGLEHTYIRYSSGVHMIADLKGGRLGAAIQPINGALGDMEAGSLHAMAMTSPERLASFPNVPTIAETLPGVALETWTGFFVPAGTPKPIIDYLYEHLAAALAEPDVVQRNHGSGRPIHPIHMTPEQTDAFVQSELPRWRDLLKDAGIEPN